MEKFKVLAALDKISEQDKHKLSHRLAPLVYNEDPDKSAKRFDNFMYGLMLASFESAPMFKKPKALLCNLAIDLVGRTAIPLVKGKLPLITAIPTDVFWASCDLSALEQVHGLIQFVIDEGSRKRTVYTDLTDVVLPTKEDESIGEAYTFEDHRLKVSRYIEQHKDETAIWKLRNNVKLTELDYQTLSDILTREFGDTPFGLLIRKIVKLEYDAAMQVFSGFIVETAL